MAINTLKQNKAAPQNKTAQQNKKSDSTGRLSRTKR